MRNFSAISWREKVTSCWDDDDARFVLDQHAVLDFYNASSLKQQSAGRHGAPFEHIIPIPSNTSQCSYSFVLGAYRRSNKIDKMLYSLHKLPRNWLSRSCSVTINNSLQWQYNFVIAFYLNVCHILYVSRFWMTFTSRSLNPTYK
jgi:hypothetical protein